MKAFHDDPKVKTKYVNRVKAHQLADEIIKGQYWDEGKGCAVGCTIHSGNHEDYEDELGIPKWLAYTEDRIFEGMSNERSKQWPLQFLEAITPGADLNKIKIPFLIFIVESALEKVNQKKFPKQTEAIKNVLVELNRNPIDKEKLLSARRTADAAADAAAYAYAYAYAAAYAADAAAYAADAAAYAYAYAYAYAAAADAAAYAYAAAREKAYEKFADKLLELMKALK